jgi:hypothetical protein
MRATGMQDFEEHPRRRLFQGLLPFPPDPLGRQFSQHARCDHLAHQRQGFGRNGKAQRCQPAGEPGHAQDAQRVFHEGWRDMPQQARRQIASAAEGIDQRAIAGARDGVDGEVAPAQILLQRHSRLGMNREAAMTRAALALGAGERIFLARAGVEEDRKITAHLPKALRAHLRGGRPEDDVIALVHRQAQQLVAHRTADEIGLQRVFLFQVGHGRLVCRCGLMAKWLDGRHGSAGIVFTS